jgi:hypothetical protein
MLSKVQLEVNKGRCFMMEVYTIQGGFTGTSLFCRIGGCDVGCHGVMLKKAGRRLHPPTSVDLVVANASKYAETVVVTERTINVDMTFDTNQDVIARSYRNFRPL